MHLSKAGRGQIISDIVDKIRHLTEIISYKKGERPLDQSLPFKMNTMSDQQHFCFISFSNKVILFQVILTFNIRVLTHDSFFFFKL